MRKNFCLTLSLMASMALAPQLWAQSGCSDSTITGSYAAVYQGYVSHEAGPAQPGISGFTPIFVVTVIKFDGAGHVLASSGGILNVGSVEEHFNILGGAYSVDSDCTGTVTFDTTLGRQFAQRILITGNGEEYRFLRIAAPRVVQSGSARRMDLAP